MTLDFSTEQTLLAHLTAFVRSRTLVLVTHKASMLGIVDRIVVLEGGKVVADGPKEAVLKALTAQSPGVSSVPAAGRATVGVVGSGGVPGGRPQ